MVVKIVNKCQVYGEENGKNNVTHAENIYAQREEKNEYKSVRNLLQIDKLPTNYSMKRWICRLLLLVFTAKKELDRGEELQIVW